MSVPTIARAAVYTGTNAMTVRELPVPDLGPDDMLVELEIAGVDGSEVHMYRGEFDWVNERVPVIFGDEIIGRVAAAGQNALAKRGLAIGDRVCVESRWPCDNCEMCDAGQYYLCENNPDFAQGYGTSSIDAPGTLWGGYASHVFVPGAALVHPVPEELSAEAALVACSVLANGASWTSAGEVAEGDHVAIIGPGPQGLSCAVAAVLKGANVTLLGIPSDVDRLAMADSLNLGIRTRTIPAGEDQQATIDAVVAENGRPRVVIETAGVPAAKSLAMELVRPMGVVVNVSVAKPQEQPVHWFKMLSRQITLKSVLAHPHFVPESFKVALRLRERGVDVGQWVTHKFALDDAGRALSIAGYETDERPVKVVLNSF